MIKSIKKFINIPIISIRDVKKIGIVRDYIIDPSRGTIIGIIVDRKGFFFKKYLIISAVDVREISEKNVVVDDRSAVVLQSEVLQIDMILKAKIKIIGSKVLTEEGSYVGRVYDYAIDDSFNIAKLYINPPISNILVNQFIINAENIIDIKKDVIIIDENNKVIETETETTGVI